MANIDNLSAAQLLAVYNFHSDKPLPRFADRATGAKRLTKLLAGIEVSLADAIEATGNAMAEPVKAEKAEKARRNAPVEKAIAKLAAKKAAAPVKPQQTSKATAKRAAKAAAPVKAAKAAAPVETGAKAPTGAKATILAMIARKGGVSEPEVCQALGWPRAGGTISRAIKVAPFAVVKVKGEDGRTRYCAA